MGSYLFSRKESTKYFIPNNDKFTEFIIPKGSNAVVEIRKYLGYHEDQSTIYFGYPDEKFGITIVVIEIFSGKILFVETEDKVVKLDKRTVNYVLKDYSFDRCFGVLDTWDILQQGVENKSLSIDFLSRVLDFHISQLTIVYAKLIDLNLTFQNGILVSFQYPSGVSKLKKFEIMLSKLKIQQNQQEQFWEAEKRTIAAKIALDQVESILLLERASAGSYQVREDDKSKVDNLIQAYNRGERSAILDYYELILNISLYPEFFTKAFELDYFPESKILVVEYSLPTLDEIPRLSEVKWVKNEYKEYYLTDIQIQHLFDETMNKITLRTIYELFEADAKNNFIDAISFNGWINAINRATGKPESNCILSIQVKKDKFMEIDLSQVDARTCFRYFKGIGSSKLSNITPIQPILQIDKKDKRFVNSYDVADSLDNSINLAAMDWEDFEHLIREIFGKEFSSNGGEVKVTQASRDGGVDAIAFDPDPIRGGKIVIQAKRYTNTVGVSAVRDLFGTVMNEGANKGILVTTADYGSDAYEFAKGKPLTLMNGANLLYLLEKHGHSAKIDINEARRMMSE